MKYIFPKITCLDDVLPAIEGHPEFIVAEREFGTVVNYVMQTPETFGPIETKLDAIRRECRGIIFDKQGQIMSRPFHKFFNVNERPETAANNLKFKDAVIMDKLDGSMIRPIWLNESVRLATKMGITDVAMQAELYCVTKAPQILRFCEDLMNNGITPLFEWCSNKNRIVVGYPEDKLVLIAARYNVIGLYFPHSCESGGLEDWAKHYDIELVKTYDNSARDMDMFIAGVRGQEQLEGYIVKWPDGHCVKVKADWYVTLHKTKDAIGREKNVVDLIVNNMLDDIIPNLQPEDLARIEKFEKEFWEGLILQAERADEFYRYVREIHETKKDFALGELFAEAKRNEKTSIINNYVFSRWDDKVEGALEFFMNHIKRNVSTQSKIDENRHLWCNAVYNGATNANQDL